MSERYRRRLWGLCGVALGLGQGFIVGALFAGDVARGEPMRAAVGAAVVFMIPAAAILVLLVRSETPPPPSP